MTTFRKISQPEIVGRKPPHDPDLEQAVLGAILLDVDALPAVVDILKPESFYATAHQDIYRACLRLMTRGEAVDILTVTEQLRTLGTLESSGGAVYLVELTNRVASAANLEYHARIVAQKALARDQIRVANSAIAKAYDDATDAFDLLAATQKELFDLANFSGRQAQDLGQIGIQVLRQLDRAMNKPDGMTGVPSGIAALDNLTGGWQQPDLVILAARPGMGKTAFVLNAAMNAAESGTPVAFFSLEMSAPQLVNRIIAGKTWISSNRIMRGNLSEDEHRRYTDAVQTISATPLYIDDTPGINIFELRAKCRRMKMKYGVGLVIIDYLQLMSGTDKKGGNREQEISEISRAVKALAKELQVPVIALSQLSRAVEQRGGSKRPHLSDLRESGSLEQDADIVAFLYRPEYYDIMEDETGRNLKGLTELIIAKHRNGALETVEMHFRADTTTFCDMSKARNDYAPMAVNGTQFPAMQIAADRSQNDEDIPF